MMTRSLITVGICRTALAGLAWSAVSVPAAAQEAESFAGKSITMTVGFSVGGGVRPRDSHDLRLMETSLRCSPPATLRWHHDVFGNSIAIASFSEMAAQLRIESDLRLQTYSEERPAFQIAPEARSYPFTYSADDRIDLGRMLERHHPDPAYRLSARTG